MLELLVTCDKGSRLGCRRLSRTSSTVMWPCRARVFSSPVQCMQCWGRLISWATLCDGIFCFDICSCGAGWVWLRNLSCSGGKGGGARGSGGGAAGGGSRANSGSFSITFAPEVTGGSIVESIIEEERELTFKVSDHTTLTTH